MKKIVAFIAVLALCLVPAALAGGHEGSDFPSASAGSKVVAPQINRVESLQTTGYVYGTIYKGGNPVASAYVTISRGGSQVGSTYTNGSGYYQFTVLSGYTYSVQASRCFSPYIWFGNGSVYDPVGTAAGLSFSLTSSYYAGC